MQWRVGFFVLFLAMGVFLSDRSLDRTEEALEIQREILGELTATGETDGYVHEELAECLHALGDEEAAKKQFALAYRALSVDPWLAENEPDRIARLKRLAGLNETDEDTK